MKRLLGWTVLCAWLLSGSSAVGVQAGPTIVRENRTQVRTIVRENRAPACVSVYRVIGSRPITSSAFVAQQNGLRNYFAALPDQHGPQPAGRTNE